jgi:hypothetical protein
MSHGRELIEIGLKEQIGATASIDFADDGLASSFELPLSTGARAVAGQRGPKRRRIIHPARRGSSIP